MLICYLCANHFVSIEVLVVHYKYQHRLKSYDHYKCGQNDCPQTFTNLQALTVHLRNHNISNEKRTTITNIPLSHNNVEIDKIEINVVEIRKEIENNTLQLLSKLISLTNLTNKQIQDIVGEFSVTFSFAISTLKKKFYQQ